jgi:guanosine-3',5'-bis(diphosphate) 3'-pyrophosphohydrolase
MAISPFAATIQANEELTIEQQQLGVDEQIQRCRACLSAHASNNEKVLESFDALMAHLQRFHIQKRGQFDFSPILNAIMFAAAKHEGQARKDLVKTPYIMHPIGVCRILWEEGKIRNTNVLVAALLHDVLEDTQTTAAEIEQHFGKRVRDTVQELTNDPALSSEENKQRQVEHASLLSWNAQCVKLADRLYNIRDLKNLPPSYDKQHIVRYFSWGRKLLHALKGTNENLEHALQKEILKFEVEGTCSQNHV